NDGGSGKITGVADAEIAEGSTDAVNGGQIHDLRETANSGWNILANGEDKSQVAPKDNVNFESSDDNIRITKNSDGNTHNMDFQLNPNLSVDSVNASEGFYVGGPESGGPSMTTEGIDAGGQKITNVAPGEDDSDAVNVGQLK